MDDIKPTWFLFENVYGLTKFKNGNENIQKHIEDRFRALGYTVNSDVPYASGVHKLYGNALENRVKEIVSFLSYTTFV